MLFKNGYYYKYQGNRTFDDLYSFLNSRQNVSSRIELPEESSWFDKLIYYVGIKLNAVVDIMDTFGLAKVPKMVKHGIIVFILLLPLIIISIYARYVAKTEEEYRLNRGYYQMYDKDKRD